MKKPAFPSDQQDKFMLRLPDGMREKIKVAAEANKRSMNAEIVARLEATFRVKSAMLQSEIINPTKPLDLNDKEEAARVYRKALEHLERMLSEVKQDVRNLGENAKPAADDQG